MNIKILLLLSLSHWLSILKSSDNKQFYGTENYAFLKLFYKCIAFLDIEILKEYILVLFRLIYRSGLICCENVLSSRSFFAPIHIH